MFSNIFEAGFASNCKTFVYSVAVPQEATNGESMILGLSTGHKSFTGTGCHSALRAVVASQKNTASGPEFEWARWFDQSTPTIFSYPVSIQYPQAPTGKGVHATNQIVFVLMKGYSYA